MWQFDPFTQWISIIWEMPAKQYTNFDESCYTSFFCTFQQLSDLILATIWVKIFTFSQIVFAKFIIIMRKILLFSQIFYMFVKTLSWVWSETANKHCGQQVGLHEECKKSFLNSAHVQWTGNGFLEREGDFFTSRTREANWSRSLKTSSTVRDPVNIVSLKVFYMCSCSNSAI